MTMNDCDYCGRPIMPGCEEVCLEQGGDPAGTWACSTGGHAPVRRETRTLDTIIADKIEDIRIEHLYPFFAGRAMEDI